MPSLQQALLAQAVAVLEQVLRVPVQQVLARVQPVQALLLVRLRVALAQLQLLARLLQLA